MRPRLPPSGTQPRIGERAAAQNWRRCSGPARIALALGAGAALCLDAAICRACPNCELGRAARASVWTEHFGANLTVALLPFLAVAVIAARSESGASSGRANSGRGVGGEHDAGSSARRAHYASPLVSAGLLLGTGLGGFVDGILLHQILQWHNMLSSIRPPTDLLSMKYNMVWDGLFHTFTWVMCALGIWRLWAAARRSEVPWSASTFVGAMCLGWGLFNFIEGLIDHQLLGIHHVHPGSGELAWDLGFLALGLLQIVGGWAVLRHASSTAGGDRQLTHT
ncbi:MAG TPA: DUF2243 domain-containing protein [Polyangiaceae bacterium]|nr:DUF2243 domain-containing protein [Polyangiaceae bacterium]